MAQFDVHRLVGRSGLVLDCQSDLLRDMATRFVVPLVRRAQAKPPLPRLNPAFDIEGDEWVMITQTPATIRRSELGSVVLSLKEQSWRVTDALDVLLGAV